MPRTCVGAARQSRPAPIESPAKTTNRGPSLRTSHALLAALLVCAAVLLVPGAALFVGGVLVGWTA